MPNSRQFIYKGYRITTRWTQLDPLSHRKQRFDASFTVHSSASDEDSWQQFPREIFDSFVAAVANALTLAQRSIDLDLAAA